MLYHWLLVTFETGSYSEMPPMHIEAVQTNINDWKCHMETVPHKHLYNIEIGVFITKKKKVPRPMQYLLGEPWPLEEFLKADKKNI